jgi:hypothetical protein
MLETKFAAEVVYRELSKKITSHITEQTTVGSYPM